ncbi:MAG: ATP-binding cassette domain-containing protein [Candidatus Thiodiazotropha sp.]
MSNQQEKELNIDRLNRFNYASNIIVFGLERILSIVILTVFVTNESITLGMFFAYMAYREIYISRANSLIESLFDLRLVQVHFSKVSDVLFSEDESVTCAINKIDQSICNAGEPVPLIECKNISFRYSDFDEFVLKNIEFSIIEGEILAIVGASGSGKTTLIKIILGLLEPTSGQLNFKHDVININDYRKYFGSVMQDESLFMGSIQDNISFFSKNINEAWMIECAKMAGIHESITSMPMAYKTVITNPYGDLSGGQRQRICLARAFYRRPKILVLDEATSHLDMTNEKIVSDSIKKMGITTILAAHRKETIALADRVYRI